MIIIRIIKIESLMILLIVDLISFVRIRISSLLNEKDTKKPKKRKIMILKDDNPDEEIKIKKILRNLIKVIYK